MIRIQYLVVVIIIQSFIACSKCDDKPLNNVKIRIQNDLDSKLVTASIGSTMYKSNDSFASCTMTKSFNDVPQGTTTDYVDTYGNHLGYDGVRVNRPGTRSVVTPSTVSREDLEDQLIKNGAVQDSVKNVYRDKMYYGLRLPDGFYTYRLLNLSDDGRFIELEIIKD